MGRCAPALVKLRDEVNQRWPNRDKASDGCCASAAHSSQNPTSDHEPGPDGYCAALDIDEDLHPGLDAWVIWQQLYGATASKADPRVKYLIYEGRIAYPTNGKRLRGVYTYTGPNPHTKHLHVSVHRSSVLDTRPWLTTQEDDLTPEQDDRLKAIELYLIENQQRTAGLDTQVKGIRRVLRLIAERIGIMRADVDRAEHG